MLLVQNTAIKGSNIDEIGFFIVFVSNWLNLWLYSERGIIEGPIQKPIRGARKPEKPSPHYSKTSQRGRDPTEREPATCDGT